MLGYTATRTALLYAVIFGNANLQFEIYLQSAHLVVSFNAGSQRSAMKKKRQHDEITRCTDSVEINLHLYIYCGRQNKCRPNPRQTRVLFSALNLRLVLTIELVLDYTRLHGA